MKSYLTNKIKKLEHISADEYIFNCTKCGEKISMFSWEEKLCKCGLTWKIRSTLIAYTKEDKNA